MHPFIELFGVKIPAYGVMLLLAFFTGYMAAVYYSRREGLPLRKVESLFFWVFLSGMVGARIFYAVEHYLLGGEASLFPTIFEVWRGGVDFFGGFIFATATLLVGIRFYGLPFWRSVDAAAVSVLLAHSVGRLSCWLAGCCYGKPTDLPIGVIFPEEAVAPSGIPLYPTQLMEATGNFIGFLLLHRLYGNKPFDGSVAATYLIYYGTERFFLEFLRGTTPPIPALGLTWNQVVSLLAVAVGVSIWLFFVLGGKGTGKGDRVD